VDDLLGPKINKQTGLDEAAWSADAATANRRHLTGSHRMAAIAGWT
jgi:hypothetical protein